MVLINALPDVYFNSIIAVFLAAFSKLSFILIKIRPTKVSISNITSIVAFHNADLTS